MIPSINHPVGNVMSELNNTALIGARSIRRRSFRRTTRRRIQFVAEFSPR
jgi:porphobilinogen deaminase